MILKRRTALFAPAGLLLGLLLLTGAPSGGQSSLATDPAVSLLSAAERRARDGDLPGALGDYEQLIQQFPQSAQAPEAMLRIAQGQLEQNDRAAALATANRLVTTYPLAPQAAGGLLLESRIRARHPEQPADLEGARKTLEKTWLLFPRTVFPVLPARSAARVLDGELALRLGQDDEALTAFLSAVEIERTSPATADAHIGLAVSLVRSGDWEAAAESLQDALAVPSASEASLARARRRLGLLERRLLRPATGGKLWTGARLMSLSGGEVKRLTGVAADDEGRLILIDSGSDRVMRVSAAGKVEKRWTARSAEKPSWGREATLQIAARDRVVVPGAAQHTFILPSKGKPIDGIRATERDPFGRWLLLAQKSEGIMSYRADGRFGTSIYPGDGDPVDLALDRLDRLYVLERKNRRVVRIDQQNGTKATAVKGSWKKPAAVTVDPFGYVHVLDGDSNRIHTYDPTGKEISVVGPVLPGKIELRRASDLAAGGDGRLYVVDARAGLVVLE